MFGVQLRFHESPGVAAMPARSPARKLIFVKKSETKTLLARKGSGGFILIYWMVINKQRVGWTEQKFQQIRHQLFNKQKTGVMGRLDIPIQGDHTQLAVSLAQKFIRDLSRAVPVDDAEYMFGK